MDSNLPSNEQSNERSQPSEKFEVMPKLLPFDGVNVDANSLIVDNCDEENDVEEVVDSSPPPVLEPADDQINYVDDDNDNNECMTPAKEKCSIVVIEDKSDDDLVCNSSSRSPRLIFDDLFTPKENVNNVTNNISNKVRKLNNDNCRNKNTLQKTSNGIKREFEVSSFRKNATVNSAQTEAVNGKSEKLSVKKSVDVESDVPEESSKNDFSAVINDLEVQNLLDAPRPEVDIVDGIKFLCWENEEELKAYTRIEETLRRRSEAKMKTKFGLRSQFATKVIVPTKTTDITKIKGWRNKVFASPSAAKSMDEVQNEVLDRISSPNSKAYSPSERQLSSALVNNFHDESVTKSKNELKLRNISNNSLSSSCNDSSILDFSSVSLKSSPSSNSSFLKLKSNSKKCDDKSSVEAISEKPKLTRGPGRPKKIRPMDPAENDCSPSDVIFDTLSEEVIERRYQEHMNFALTEHLNRMKQGNPSLIMDEQYIRFALEVLNVQLVKEDNSQPNDVLSAVGLTPTNRGDDIEIIKDLTPKTCKAEQEADITKIISRHSKRDIRLPARYHQSGLLLGSQWVIPEMDNSVKNGSKRLKQEQKRLLLQQKMTLCAKRNYEQCDDNFQEAKKLHSNQEVCDSEMKAKSMKDSLPGNSLLLKKPKVFQNQPISMQLKLHKQRMIQIQQVKKKQELQERKNFNIEVNSVEKPETISKPKTIVETVIERFSQAKETSEKSEAVEPKLKNPNNQSLKEKRLMELKELYRLLYYENNPERRLICSKKGIKPRVNKKEVVEEGVETIQKLKKREEQLDYIKKNLSTWNNQLKICVKAVNAKRQEGNSDDPHTIQALTNVLKAYRSSVAYRLSEALDNKRKELNTSATSANLTGEIKFKENDVIIESEEIKSEISAPLKAEVPNIGTSFAQESPSSAQVSTASGLLRPHSEMLALRKIKKLEHRTHLLQQTAPTKSPILKTVSKPTTPTFVLNTSVSNTLTSSSNVALWPKGIPLLGPSAKIASLIPSSKIVSPHTTRLNVSQLQTPSTIPIFTRIFNASESYQRSILSTSSRPLSATICRPTTATLTRPTTTAKTVLMTPRLAAARPSVVNMGPINTKSLTAPMSLSNIKPMVTGPNTQTGFMVRVSSNTLQVPLIQNTTNSGQNANVLLPYCLKDNKLVPLVPLKSTANGIPVFKIAQKKLSSATAMPKVTNNNSNNNNSGSSNRMLPLDLAQTKF